MAAILTDPPAPPAARCAHCGAAFRCDRDAPAGCWCARMPALDGPFEAAATCLCEPCLRDARMREERARVHRAAGLGPLELRADAALDAAAAAAWAGKTMPAGALGALQALGSRLVQVLGRCPPAMERCAMLVFAADHGLAAERVSAYPPEVTAQMVRNFGDGGAAIAVLCRAHDVALTVVDAGTLAPQAPDFAPRGARFVDARIGAGTANALERPAMTEAQALAAIGRGAAIARDTDAEAIGLGEMGIGNSSAAALLAARLAPAPLLELIGRGTGLDDAGLQRKRMVLERVAARHARAQTPLAALAAFGGFELAMIVGAALAAAAQRRIVVVDGFVASAAVLVAARLEPALLESCVFAHRSAEPGHARMLEAMAATPLLDLGLRLGEGSGAALAMPLLRAASRLLAEMATFEQAGVSRG